MFYSAHPFKLKRQQPLGTSGTWGFKGCKCVFYQVCKGECVYLDTVTRVGLGRASRSRRTAATSLSISSSVLTWWGSSTVSQVNPA